MKKANASQINLLNQKNAHHLFHISKLSNDALLDEMMLKSFGEYKNRKTRVAKFGKNQLGRKHFNWFKIILEQFIQPFNLVMLCLITLDLVSYFVINAGKNETSDIVSACVSITILMITFTTAEIEGYHSFVADNKTKDAVSDRFLILKKELSEEDLQNVNLKELAEFMENINRDNITIGDIIMLHPGDIVPADMRVIYANGLAVDDNFIRGKVARVKKSTAYAAAEHIYDLKNIILSQSIITDGYVLGVVVAIGKNKISNEFSKIAEKESTAFYHRGIKKITFFVLLSTLIIFPISLLSVYFSSSTSGIIILVESILYSITVVVALIPESLPAVVAFNLQHGNRHIKNEKVIVKNAEAIQDLGAIDVFFSNKTGTITKDRPMLVNWVDINGEKNDQVANIAYLNAFFQPSLHFHFEQAIIDMFDESKRPMTEDFELVRTNKYNEIQKDGTVILKNNDVFYQYTVTSFEELNDSIMYYDLDGQVLPLSEEMKNNIHHMGHDFVINGFRPLVVVSKIITDENIINNDDLMFEGILVFKDLIRETIMEALTIFKKYQIDFKIISGDTLDVVKHAVNEIGFNEIKALTGDQITVMTNDEQHIFVKGINVFAKLSPIQKSLVIHDYIKLNKVVAYLGDGSNDVLAIKKADVGIVSNASTPLAKKFADIIVLDRNLNNFDGPIRWGRITFLNTLKFIKLSISTNLGLYFALFVSAICFPFFPLTSTQLLIQNLFIDFANISFMADNVSDKSIQKPIKWKTKSIIPFVLIHAVTPALVSLSNLFIISYGLGWFSDGLTNTDAMAQQIQTTFFIESWITRITMIFVLRTDEIWLWKDLPRWKFVLVMSSVLIMLVIIPYIPKFNDILDMRAPDAIWWPIMIGNIGATVLLGSGVKWAYQKVFKAWF